MTTDFDAPLRTQTIITDKVYFVDPMLIMAALLLLMLAVGGWHLRLLVRGSAWVKNPYIKKCFLEPTAPKATRGDVQASLVVALDRAGNEGFTSQRLKRCLCCHVVAYFPQQTGCEVSHLIVPEGWVTADWTGQCMLSFTNRGQLRVRNSLLAKIIEQAPSKNSFKIRVTQAPFQFSSLFGCQTLLTGVVRLFSLVAKVIACL